MRQFKKKQKLVATLMAAVALSGSKVTPPVTAMSQGLNKANVNKKSGLPTWAKWTLIGGASVVGAAAIAGTIWYCLKDKNKNPQAPDKENKKNKEIPTKLNQGDINKEKNKLYMIKEDVGGENKSEEENDEKETENKKNVKEENKEEEFPIINNPNLEEEAKQKLEQQENENAFYEAVAKYNVLSNFMNALRDPSNYVKFLAGIYKDGKLNNNVDNLDEESMERAMSQFNDFKKDISVNGKKSKIELLKNEPGNIEFKIIFNNDMSYNIVISDNNLLAIKVLGLNGVLFKFQNNIV